LFALAGSALAQKPTQAQIGAIRQACRSDYQTYCSNVPTGGSAALACLQQNAQSLSAPCQQALAAANGSAPAAEGQKPAPAAGAPASTPPASASHPPPPMSPRQEAMLLRRSCARIIRPIAAMYRPVEAGSSSACERMAPRCRANAARR
jgi:hypothetical protein